MLHSARAESEADAQSATSATGLIEHSLSEPSSDLVVVGGGEHARVVIEAARSQPQRWRVLGFLEPLAGDETTRRLGVPRLGDDADAAALASRPGVRFVIGVGALAAAVRQREQLAVALDACSVEWACIVHERAWVSPTAVLGDGTVVLAGALVNTGASVGRHVIINSGAVVEHEVEIGDFSHVGPGAVIGGGAVVGRSALLGLGCRVRDHIRIEDRAQVGMGAVVVSRVEAGKLVLGVPARARAVARRG